MSDLIQQGQIWHNTKRGATRTVPVTLSRDGEADTLEVPATVGSNPVQSIDESGLVITSHSQDFVIDVLEYAFADVAVEPEEGDRITIDSLSATFEVRPPPGEPAFRYTNSYQLAWRIHTNGVDV